MLQLHIESLDNEKLYRKLQVATDQTIFDFEMILEVVFELDEVDAEFRVVRTGGKHSTQKLYAMPMDEWLEDSSDELLVDLLLQPGDELHVIDPELEVKVVLERFVSKEHEVNTCIAGAGHLYAKGRRKVDLEAINMELADLQMVSLEEFDEELEPDFGELLELSNELNKLKPWQYFDTEDVIAVEIEETDVTFFASVRGVSGQEYGLMIYDELFGYPIMQDILAQKPLSPDFSYEMSGLSVNFVDRDELEEWDYALIKEYGFTFRGKKKWIQFRKFYPGAFPELPNYLDVEILKLIVQAMIELTKRVKKGLVLPKLEPDRFMGVLVSLDGDVSESYIRQVEARPEPALEIELNDLECAKYKRRKKMALQIEFDMFYIPHLTRAPGDEIRLIYPVIYAALDCATDENIFFEAVPFPKIVLIQQQLFWEMLNAMPVRPSKVFVCEEVQKVLAPLAKKLGVELVVSELPIMQEFRAFIENMPPEF